MTQIFVRAAIVCVMAIGATAVLAGARRAELPVERTPFASFPMTLDGWKAQDDPPLDDDIVKVLGVDDYLSRIYYKSGAAVGLYMGFYGSQRQGDTIHSPLNCLPGAGWEPVSADRVTIANVDNAGRNIEINRYVVQKGLDRQLVLYWYQSHGRVVASEYWSRALLINDAIRLNRTDGALVRVIAPIIDNNADAAEALAVSFVRALFPALPGYLPE